MRLIHTADWHLGNRLHEIDRAAEADAFLSWLTDEIRARQAQALIVAGDIFDVVSPSIEARRQYCRFLASLQATDCKNVVIVGGNHDSGALLDTEKELLSAFNIHIVGSISNITADDMVFELYDATGAVCGICAAVPYARESELRGYYDGDAGTGEYSDKAYAALYDAVLAAAHRLQAGRKLPIVATGHLYADDLEGRLGGAPQLQKADDGTKPLDPVGNLGAVHVAAFPAAFDYVALGHIHYASTVAGRNDIRYSGSPFVLGFDEAHLKRHILCVDVAAGEEPTVEKIVVPETVTFKRIAGNCESIRAALEAYIAEPPQKKTYLELYYQKEVGVDIRQELEETVETLAAQDVFVISWRLQEAEALLQSGLSDYDMEELRNLDEDEIFKSLILSKITVPPDTADDERERLQQDALKTYLPLFKQVASEVSDEDN